MNLVYGEIVSLLDENDMHLANVCVSGALKKVPLDLLTNVKPGDTVLLCDGVAISKVDETIKQEGNNVSRYSG